MIRFLIGYYWQVSEYRIEWFGVVTFRGLHTFRIMAYLNHQNETEGNKQMNIQANTIVTGFDGKNYWPKKILKVTKTRATVINCTPCGRELGEPVTKKIDHHSGKPSMQFHPCEIVYLTEAYDKNLYGKYSDI